MSVPTQPTSPSTVAGSVPAPRTEADLTAVRPFEVHVPEEQLADLRRRIAATRWPDKETVDDASQGVQLATMQALARYWDDRVRLAQVRGQAQLGARSSSPRSTGWTSTSSTLAPSTRTRCRSSSATDGPAR